MFAFLQVLCVIILFVGTIVFFSKVKRKPLSIAAGLCVLLVISSVISAYVLKCIPMATEQITLTATGEKNENALNNEVALSAVIADGKKYEINNAVEGKWFWQGNNYMWRNEGDARQPEGTTRSVTLEIPIGAGRKLIFNNNPYRGIVEITYNGETAVYDLYREGSESTKISIPSTDAFYDNIVKIGRLALFVFFILAMMAYPVSAAIKFDYERIKKWFARNWDKLVYLLIASVQFIVAFNYGKESSFWYDEVWNLGWIYTENPNKSYIIFDLLQRLWFNIVPYGQEYLLIFSEFFVAVAIYICGLIGRMYKDCFTGILTAVLFASSSTVMVQCSLEFRPYGMLMFAIAIMVYNFLKKQSECGKEKTLTVLRYGLSLVLVMDCHEFGIATAGLMMLFDLVQVLKKRSSKKVWLEFVFPGIYGVYWLITQFAFNLGFVNNYSWTSSPNTKSVINCIIELCGNNSFVLLMLILGIIFISGDIIRGLVGNDIKTVTVSSISIIGVPILLFTANILYSAIVNPENSLFVNRYMTPCIVYFDLIAANAIHKIITLVYCHDEKITFNNKAFSNILCIVIGIGVFLCTYEWVRFNHSHENYKGAGEWLMTQNDIYCDTTLCIVMGKPSVNDGFEYYLSKKGKYDSINHITNYMDLSGLNQYYGTIYVLSLHNDSSGITNYILDMGYTEISGNPNLKIQKFVL